MLTYNFIRENDLNSRELHFLSIVSSYSNESHLKVSQYAEMIKVTDRTIKRIIQSLKNKKRIEVRYGLYKSIHISISKGTPVALIKGTKTTFKRDKNDTQKGHPRPFQYREHKENIKRPPSREIFKSEDQEHPGTGDIPEHSKHQLNQLKSKLGLIKLVPK